MAKRIHHSTPAVVFLFLLVFFLMSGCTGGQYQSEVRQYSVAFLGPLDEKAKNDKRVSETGPVDIKLSLQKALEMAAKKDEEVVAELAELQKAKIDVRDAMSHRWPRLGVNAAAEIPVADNKSEGKVESTGGVYFKYDLWKVIAAGDEQAMREAFVRKELEKLKLVLNNLLKKILHNLSQTAYLEFKVQKRAEALEISNNAYGIAKIYAEQMNGESSLLASWQSRLDNLTLDQKKSEQELQQLRFALANLLGVESSSNITITDLAAIFAADSAKDSASALPAPSEIWEKHGEARLAEVDYIAAEVQAKLTAMESWPKIETSLGLGSIPLAGTTDTAPTLLKLSVDYPLFDMGDNERKLSKAKLNRDLLKTRLPYKAAVLYNRAKEALYLFQAADKNYQNLSTIYLRQEKRVQEESTLLAKGRITPLEHAMNRLNLIEAEMLRRESLTRLQEAGENYKYTIGEDIITDCLPVTVNILLENQGMTENTDAQALP